MEKQEILASDIKSKDDPIGMGAAVLGQCACFLLPLALVGEPAKTLPLLQVVSFEHVVSPGWFVG